MAKSPLTQFRHHLAAKSPGVRVATATALIVAALAAVTVGALARLTDLAAVIGAPAGAVLYVAALAGWDAAPASWRAKVDAHARFGTAGRRAFVGVCAALFVTAVLLTGRHLPVIVAGTAVVTATLVLWHLFRTSAPAVTTEPGPADDIEANG